MNLISWSKDLSDGLNGPHGGQAQENNEINGCTVDGFHLI